MANAYTVLWTQHHAREVRKYGLEGTPLTMLFGGPHTSEPSFLRAGVKPDDLVYPIRLLKGVLYLVACMRVRQVMSLQAFIDGNPDLFAGVERGRWTMATLENYLALHPEQRYLASTCTEEVVVGEARAPIRLDVAIPPEVLERMRYRSQRRERGIKYIEDGKLKSIVSIQGIYRLAESSAADLEAILSGTHEKRSCQRS